MRSLWNVMSKPKSYNLATCVPYLIVVFPSLLLISPSGQRALKGEVKTKVNSRHCASVSATVSPFHILSLARSSPVLRWREARSSARSRGLRGVPSSPRAPSRDSNAKAKFNSLRSLPFINNCDLGLLLLKEPMCRGTDSSMIDAGHE
jgi:hypothetical protein